MPSVTSVTLSRWIASSTLYSASTARGRAERNGCGGVIVRTSSGSPSLRSRNAMHASRIALLPWLHASGSSKSGSISLKSERKRIEMAAWNRMKLL